jgi:hypothetical protein
MGQIHCDLQALLRPQGFGSAKNIEDNHEEGIYEEEACFLSAWVFISRHFLSTTCSRAIHHAMRPFNIRAAR